MGNSLRLSSHPFLAEKMSRQRKIKIFVNNQPFDAREGESLAAALWANGLISIRHTIKSGEDRGMYCGIGHCYECRVTVDGMRNIRSCMTIVRDNMQVYLQKNKG